MNRLEIIILLLILLICVYNFIIFLEIRKMVSKFYGYLRRNEENYEVEELKIPGDYTGNIERVSKKRYGKRRIVKRSELWLARMEKQGGEE